MNPSDLAAPARVVLPEEVRTDRERLELAKVAAGRAGVTDASGPARTLVFWASVAVWFPVLWSGSKAMSDAVTQELGVLVLAAGLLGVLNLANSFARGNALQVLKKDRQARARLSPEQHALLDAFSEQPN